jgi:general secretion pathway protein I
MSMLVPVSGLAGRRGFTLLEVLVAVAILGLGLTVILSSQVGLFSSATRGEHLTIATGLVRCKMSEVEEKLLREQAYPLTDQNDEGDCCGDDSDGRYRCVWKIERVELPQLPDQSADGGVPGGDMGPLGALAGLSPGGSAAAPPPDLGKAASPTDLAGQLSGAGAAMQGMGPMLMALVYPGLKPMLEASIRKVTVTAQWKEGSNERSLSVIQYVTNPQQGDLQTMMGAGGAGALGTGTGTTGANPLGGLFGAPGGGLTPSR